jgi:hypothetical protein
MIKTLTSIAFVAAMAFAGPVMAQEMTSGSDANGPRSTYDGGSHTGSGTNDQRAEYCARTHQHIICTYNAN